MTITLEREARRNAALFTGDSFASAHKPKMSFAKKKNAEGVEVNVLQLTDVPVFRSGTFRDSLGLQHTWETIHMDQMVAHFDMLRGREILPHIPVRKGHGSFLGDPMDGLIGYHSALRTKELKNPSDQQTYIYLLADYDILDTDAITKISNGLWRNRSAEVGSYITNAEAEFWPVYMGVAYVDFSAVEGLNAFSAAPGVGTKFSLMVSEKEAPVSGTEGTPEQVAPAQAPVIPAPPAAQPPVPAQPQVAQTPPAAAPVTEENENENSEQSSEHSRGGGNVHSFSINGVPTHDFGAVQRHISGLEQFRSETIEAGRKAFVNGLAGSNKITAPQIEATEKFALSLTDEQWGQWVASWNAAPPQSVTGLHGAGSGNGTTHQQDNTDQLEIDKGIIRQHTLAGMRQEVLEKTPSWRRVHGTQS